MRGRLECGVRFLLVADMSIVGDIAGRAGKDERRSGLDGFFHVDGGGKLFPGDADQFGGVARLRRRIGDRHRDDVADMMDLVCRHHRIGLQRRLRPVGVGDRSDTGESAEIGEIARDIDGADARRGARGLDIVDAEFRMPMGTAQKHRPELGALDRVGGVIAAAADQANVLNALDALTHSEFRRFHVVSIPCSGAIASSRLTGFATLLIEFRITTKPPPIYEVVEWQAGAV